MPLETLIYYPVMKKRNLLSFAFCITTFAALGLAQPTITSVLDPYTGGTKLAPGSLAILTGTNLGQTPLVTVGGKNASNLVQPLGATTMTIQIPVDAAVGTTVPVIVSNGQGTSGAFNIALVQYAPVLIVSTSGSQTSPRHGNGVGITSSTPAAPGEVINIYAIGLGPTTPTVSTGQTAQNTTTATTTQASVNFGTNSAANGLARLANGQGFFGANASSGLTGSTPALVGVYVVTHTIPAATAAGTYPLTVTIGGVTSNSINIVVGAAPTAPVISAIVGESGKTQLCPGDIAILSGLNLGTNPTVNVGAKAAFIVQSVANANQITIQIPVDAATGSANVTLTQGSQTSAAFPITLTQFAPALLPGGGFPNAPFHLTQGGSPVTQANPAVAGETLGLLMYGLGPTNPVVPTGTPVPSNPSPATVTTPTVNIGPFQATGVSASLNPNPGSVGQYFVSFTVPTGLITGGTFLTVSIGGTTSNYVNFQVFSGPVISNVKNAASNLSAGLPNAGIAQGAIFVLTGTSLGPSTISIASNAFQSNTLSGTSISATVAGTTVAPTLYYTSATQVAALLPSNTPLGTGNITVTYNGTVGLPAPITVVQNNVGIFTASSDGFGAGIVTYPDYSLVSPMKAANCGGVYTTCGAANPGDVLTVWATGLGPVNGNESGGAGLGVDMTTVDAKLLLGGVAQTIVFKGRGCCIGEDQIAFVVADNTPTGCAVPIAIQIGNNVSNYAVIAVAPKGSRTCTASDPSFPSSAIPAITTTTAPFTFGQFDLKRQPQINGQGQFTGNTDRAAGFAATFTIPVALQPFMVSYLDVPPLGTCQAFGTLRIPDGGDLLTNFVQVDAGPSFKVTGPNGSQTIAFTGDDIVLPANFLAPGAYTITGTGGAKIGTINASITIPALPVLTGLTNGGNVTVTRANGATVNWTGGAGTVVIISGQQATDNSFTNGASFQCFVDGKAGTFTIPPSVLLSLPTGVFGSWDFTPRVYGNFTATGLQLGVIQANFDTNVNVTVQ
jgi:uncharacterized protein (TIGR03437 family)